MLFKRICTKFVWVSSRLREISTELPKNAVERYVKRVQRIRLSQRNFKEIVLKDQENWSNVLERCDQSVLHKYSEESLKFTSKFHWMVQRWQDSSLESEELNEFCDMSYKTVLCSLAKLIVIGLADHVRQTEQTFEIRKRAIVGDCHTWSTVAVIINHLYGRAWVPPWGGTHRGRSKTYGKTVTLCQIWEV